MDANDLKDEAKQGWEWWRRFVKAHGLTAFWIGIAAGFALGAALV